MGSGRRDDAQAHLSVDARNEPIADLWRDIISGTRPSGEQASGDVATGNEVEDPRQQGRDTAPAVVIVIVIVMQGQRATRSRQVRATYAFARAATFWWRECALCLNSPPDKGRP